MGIVPTKKLERLQFYEAHVAPWTANAAAINLTPAMITAFTPKVTAARAAFTAQQAAIQAAKAATEAFNNAMNTLHDSSGGGAELIRVIKNWAESKNDPNVYVLAQIPAPAVPQPAAAPGTPTNFVVGLLENGSVVLKWKSVNPPGIGGTVYEVKRQTGGAGPFVYVGSTGLREFVDDTVPASGGGGVGVVYQITGVRTTVRGESAFYTVRFGIGGGGLTIESVTQETARLAA